MSIFTVCIIVIGLVNSLAVKMRKSSRTISSRYDAYSLSDEEFKDLIAKQIPPAHILSVSFHSSDSIHTRYAFVVATYSSWFTGNYLQVVTFSESDSILQKQLTKINQKFIPIKNGNDVDRAALEVIQKETKAVDRKDATFAKPLRNKTLASVTAFTFENPPDFDTYSPNFFNVYNLGKWMLTEKSAIIPSKEQLIQDLGVTNPTFDAVLQEGVFLTWLGHATMLVSIHGVNVLTDPVFSQRLSPVSFMGPKRCVPMACEISDLPEIHLVLISHTHYDHYDSESVTKLNERFPNAAWFVSLGMESMLRVAGIRNVKEMDWGNMEKINISVTDKIERPVSVLCVPAQHWSARNLIDKNKILWSGFVVSVKNREDKKTMYFAGDTGFCRKEFKKIGNVVDVDVALIPIGCYEPSWIMRSQHISPKEAVAVHKLVGAKKSVAIHWGTYDMGSSESFMQPKTDLEKEKTAMGLSSDEFTTVSIGATIQMF